MKTDPTERGTEEAGTVGSDVQGVSAAKVDGNGAWSIHDKFARRSPDGGVNRAFFERDAFAVTHGLEKADARARVNLNFADFGNGDCGARTGVGDEKLSDFEFAFLGLNRAGIYCGSTF